MSKLSGLALWVVVLGGLACSTPVLADDAPAEGGPANMPSREHELVAILADAQKQFSANRAGSAQDARVAMQIHVISFMRQSQAAQDWVGTVKSRGIADDGNAWISIDIGNGATVSTWQNDRDDMDWATMFRPYSPLFAAAKTAQIGQRVLFSGTILKSVLASDDEMVNRPQFIARFTSLKVAQ